MLKQISINLCDYRGTYASAEAMLRQYETFRSTLDVLCPQCEFDEVWMGSEFCENLFLCIPEEQYQKKIDYFTSLGLRVQIAVPELHETNFERAVSLLQQMQNTDGFVVNDIGTAVTVHRIFPQKKLILGRSFDKSVREIRCVPSEICSKYEREAADLHKELPDPVHTSFFRSIGATGITTDSVPYYRSEYNASELQIYFQYPRMVLSHAAICEFSMTAGNNPLRGCEFGCFSYEKRY